MAERRGSGEREALKGFRHLFCALEMHRYKSSSRKGGKFMLMDSCALGGGRSTAKEFRKRKGQVSHITRKMPNFPGRQ
jgi:hypothetical protein